MQDSLGTITVTTPGTAVQVTINQALPAANLSCQSILIQALSNATHTNVGRIYILDKFGRRLATLGVPTTSSIPSFSATIPNAIGALDASLYYIDADSASDGVDASILRP